MKCLMLYLLLINALGFLLMLIDKRKAILGRWRIPEKTLFLVACVGGSIGSLICIHLFRHKTKHLKFTLGMPLILALQVAFSLYLYAMTGFSFPA